MKEAADKLEAAAGQDPAVGPHPPTADTSEGGAGKAEAGAGYHRAAAGWYASAERARLMQDIDVFRGAGWPLSTPSLSEPLDVGAMFRSFAMAMAEMAAAADPPSASPAAAPTTGDSKQN